MKFLSLFSGAGGLDLGLERSGFECVGQVEIIPYALKVLKKRWPKVPKHTDILTLLRGGSLVKTFRLLDQGKDLREKEAVYFLSLSELLEYLNQNGYCLKMFPDSFPLTEDGIWRSFFKKWPKAATGGLTEYLTADISESPKTAVECSLSEVLETTIAPKYYLSRKAVEGIIRRSWRDGRNAYVLMHEPGKEMTQQLKRLSLRTLELPKAAKGRKGILEKLPIQLQLDKGVLKDDQGREITLRKLTPTEKEKLQGFPELWTLCEDS